MATIRQRGAHWEAQVRRRGWPVLSKSFSTKAEARAWAVVTESEFARGVFVDRTEAERTTLGDLLKRYLVAVSAHKKGAVSERYRILALLRDPLAEFNVAGLTSKVVAEWRDRRLQKVSGSSTNRDLNLLSHVINIARKEWGMHVDNPIAMIRRPQENRPRRRRLSKMDEARLLEELTLGERSIRGMFKRGGCRNPWMRPLVEFAIETAMRRSELLALRWLDVHLNDRFVCLHDSKNGEPREVPLSRKACGILADLPRDSSGKVFPVSGDAVKKAFTRAVERAGLGDLHFHDLRHEATSRIAEKLDNVLELSAVTGHKTLSMLKRYYHPRASDLARKLD